MPKAERLTHPQSKNRRKRGDRETVLVYLLGNHWFGDQYGINLVNLVVN